MGILLIIIIFTVLIAKYAINEGRRVEAHNKFMKNLEKFDKHGITKNKGKG